MDIRILTPAQAAPFADQLMEMLRAGDAEFFPPLSTRGSTTQAAFGGQTNEDGILQYFRQMQTQPLMVATEGDTLCAFVSFIENYQNAEIGAALLPNIYLSTLIVSPACRGQGLTKRMYAALFEQFADRHICTRTWSTNTPHIRILDTFGFETLCVLENHRAPGVHTVYFHRPIQ